MQELVITIIGFGNIGKNICSLLLPSKACKLYINIIDVDWSVQGAILDMEHGNQLYGHEITYNSDALFNASDFIFHCAGASVPIGKSRLVTCKASIEITETIFKNFKPVKTPFIIVVANPVEVITLVTQKITGLPKQNVVGTGTFLDSIRMNYIVKKTNLEITSVDAVILGEHGTSAFLSRQLSKVNGESFSTLFDTDTIEELMILMKASAEEIKKTQGATIYGVSNCAVQLFWSLLSENVRHLTVSTFVSEQLNKYIDLADVSLSLYSEVSQSGVVPVDSYQPDDYEIACLKKSAAMIRGTVPQQYL